MEALSTLVSQTDRGQRVNSIFGEGVSPKLRKVRDGVEALGLPADVLLRHGRRRVIYCVPLISNVLEFMIGIDRRPKYLIPPTDPEKSTAAIAQWWKERWYRQRAVKDEVLQQVEQHTLVYPITHGARVRLPTSTEDSDDAE